MYRLVLVLSTLLAVFSCETFISGQQAVAGEGEALFGSLHCTSCHKPKEKSVAASLTQIANTYGDEEKLIKFFKGESKPVIETEKAGMMRGQMPKLAGLSDDQRKALADYIFSFK